MKARELVRAVLGPPQISRGADYPITPAIFGRGLDGLGSIKTSSGENVTEIGALQTSTVWSCVFRISSTISALPCHAYTKRGGTRERIDPTPGWMEYPGMFDRQELIGQALVSLLLWGNAYIVVLRNDAGRVAGLHVLDPARVTAEADGTFTVQLDDGRRVQLRADEVAHVRGMMLPGRRLGLSPIAYARESIGLSQAATKYGGTFFDQSAVPDVVLSAPGPVTQVGADQIIESWMKGPGSTAPGRRRVALVTEGVTAEKLTIPPDDAQFLQTRQFQVADIANIYLMPLHLLNREGPQFGDTVSENQTIYVSSTLLPWTKRIENALTKIMHADGYPRPTFAKINVDGLQRGDFTQRWMVYAQATREGLITANEARAWEDMPPVPWGDEPISVQTRDTTPEPVPTEVQDA